MYSNRIVSTLLLGLMTTALAAVSEAAKPVKGETAPGLAIVADTTGIRSDTFGVYTDSRLVNGDCVSVIPPSRDGVSKGITKFFLPGGSEECRNFVTPGHRRLFANVGVDLDQDGDVGTDETVFGRLTCAQVYIKNSPIGATTTTNCSMNVHEISYAGEEIDTVFSRTAWKIEWSNVQVFHVSGDERLVEAMGEAEIFEMVQVRKNRRDKVSRGFHDLDFEITFDRQEFP